MFKNFLYFLIFLGNGNPEKILIFQGTKTLKNSNIKNFHIFSQKKPKLFLYFGKQKPRKNLFIFQEWQVFYISGSNFPSSKSKKKKTHWKSVLYFEECNFLAPSPKNKKLLKFSEKRKTFPFSRLKPEKTKKPAMKKFLLFSEKKVLPLKTTYDFTKKSQELYFIDKITRSYPSRIRTITVRVINPKSHHYTIDC